MIFIFIEMLTISYFIFQINMKKNIIELNEIETIITKNHVDVIIKNSTSKVFDKFMKAVTCFIWMENNNSTIEFGDLFLFFNCFNFEFQNVKLFGKDVFQYIKHKNVFFTNMKILPKRSFFSRSLKKKQRKNYIF